MTIHEAAKAIGVSPTTISRTLSGQGRISARTRERVLQRMQELGYTPNLLAQRLVTRRSFTAAFDWGHVRAGTLGDTYQLELALGVQAALHSRGYGLLLNAPGCTETMHRWVSGRAVDGVFLVGRGHRANAPELEVQDHAAVRAIVAQGIPCIFIGFRAVTDCPGSGSVVLDLSVGARQAAQHLAQTGRRRIAYLASEGPDDFLDGLRAGLGDAGVALDETQVRIAGVDPEDGERSAEELLALPAPPDAIVCRTDSLAVGVLRAARRLGRRVPEDLAVTGHDDVPFARLTEPPLATIRIPVAEIGEAAAALLFELLDDFRQAPAPRPVRSRLVVRASAGAEP